MYCIIQLFHGITCSLIFSTLRMYIYNINITHNTLQLDIGGFVQSLLGTGINQVLLLL